jgi:beta-phosphoglucomutase-like phosphatase (HAD superfamily)
MIKMVVFDIAGTTVNENNVVYKIVQKAINEKGFNVSLKQVLVECAGKEKLHAIKSVLSVYLNNNDGALANDVYQRFVVLLEDAFSTVDILPNGNAEKLFEELHKREILVVLNTGYNSQTASRC